MRKIKPYNYVEEIGIYILFLISLITFIVSAAIIFFFIWSEESSIWLNLGSLIWESCQFAFYRRSLNFPWQAPEVLTKDGAYTIQEERDVRNAMQLCSESFDL